MGALCKIVSLFSLLRFYIGRNPAGSPRYATMSKNSLSICVSVALLALSAAATQLKVLTIEQLTGLGESVVQGVVTSKVCQRDGDGRIFTRVDLAIKERWKGSRAVVTIVHAGGVLGDEAAFADGQEQYDVGEEVVAFVRFNNRGEAITVGMNQGKFRVFKHNGETLVYSPFHGATATESERRPLRLSELKARVMGGAQ